MGAKKGKGGGLFAFCMRVLYIPFYYPTYWFLWFVVELIGGQKIPLISKTLMEKKWIKDGVKFLKEFRGVLQQYLGMPGAAKPSGNCKNCGQKAKFWCMDCSKKFCPQCALHQHPPGTSSEQHSIEELCDNWSRDGVHILSPILPEIMAVLASLWIFTYVPMFEENYLTRADMCPVVSSFRQASAYLDPHLFYWYKASFTSWCNYEDSFWKLLTDAWVRGIVTETDSSLLVFMNLPQALLFEVVVVIVMVPIISVMYALLLNVVFAIELYIPDTDLLRQVESVTNLFDITGNQYFGSASSALEDMDRKAPDTKPRRRDATDFMDASSYWFNRKMKYFRYFYNTTSASMRYFAWQVTMTVVCFRLACVWFGWGGYVRDLCAALGMQTKIATHQMWFQDAAGRMLLSESHVWSTASALPDVVKAFVSVMPEPLIRSAWMCGKMLIVAWILTAAAICSFAVVIVKQRRNFSKRWHSGGQAQALDFLQETIVEEEKVKAPSMRFGKRQSIIWGAS